MSVPTTYSGAEWTDFFGNRVGYFAIEHPHRSLTVTSVSVVETDGHGDGLLLFGGKAWEHAREEVREHRTAEATDAAAFVLDSPLVRASATPTPPVQQLAALILESVRGGSASFDRIAA